MPKIEAPKQIWITESGGARVATSPGYARLHGGTEYIRADLSCFEVDEVQRRMDAVVDAAVEWRQSDDVWSDALEAAVDSFLELRDSAFVPQDSDVTIEQAIKVIHRKYGNNLTLFWHDAYAAQCGVKEPSDVLVSGDTPARDAGTTT